MTAEMEKMLTSISNNSLPDVWKTRSYPSKKPLMSYIKDLKERLRMLDEWISNGQP
jgi:dynein heavy chain